MTEEQGGGATVRRLFGEQAERQQAQTSRDAAIITAVWEAQPAPESVQTVTEIPIPGPGVSLDLSQDGLGPVLLVHMTVTVTRYLCDEHGDREGAATVRGQVVPAARGGQVRAPLWVDLPASLAGSLTLLGMTR